MTIYKEKIVDLSTGETTFRDYTPEEIAEIEAEQARIAAIAAEIEAKEAARLAVLEKLGLTAEEAAALLG